jgi:prophage regulatory protein
MTATLETAPHRQITPQDISAAADPDALLTVHTVAALTGFTVATIRERAREGRFPAPIRLGSRTVRWRARDVRDWLVDPVAWEKEHRQRAAA